MTDVKWIKLPVDFFEQISSRLILKKKTGERILLLWLKLLCLAGRSNRAGAILSEVGVPVGPSMLPIILDEDEDFTASSVVTLKELGLISEKRGAIYINGFDEEQSLEEFNRQKELTRVRVQRYRERKRAAELAATLGDGEDEGCNGECNGDVTQSNGTYIDKNRKENNKQYYRRGDKKPPPRFGDFDATEVYERKLRESYAGLDDDDDDL